MQYIGTRKTRVSLHGMPMRITKDRLRDFSSKFGQVGDVPVVICKAGIATGNFVLQVTTFDIPDILTCRGRIIFVIVEGRRPCRCLCGTTVHLSKGCAAATNDIKYSSVAREVRTGPQCPRRVKGGSEEGTEACNLYSQVGCLTRQEGVAATTAASEGEASAETASAATPKQGGAATATA